MKELQITRIKFPDIQLQTRDAHKLRGYFGNLFREHSPLLHNHFEDGRLRYKYPLVQYKVIDKTPMLIGLKEGAELLIQLFLKIKEINIDKEIFEIQSKNIENEIVDIGSSNALHSYIFKSLWMPLNQENYNKYRLLESEDEKRAMLNRTLIGNLLGFFSNMNLEITDRLLTQVSVKEKATNFKGNKMLAFAGDFTSNVILPDYIGLGKSTARGFGTIKRE